MSGIDVAAELQRLDEQVQACTRCDLYRGATRGVPGDGRADARIMLVGEAPGRNEDKQGRPFVGAAGKFLEELLGVAGLTRSDVYITNVVKHWPNQHNGQYLANRAPEPEEIAACRSYLDRQVTLLDPRLIVTLGRFSLGAFFPGETISRVHGQLREKDGRHYFIMYHPAAALHQQSMRETLIADMKKLADFIRGPFASEPTTDEKADVDIPSDPEQLSLFQ